MYLENSEQGKVSGEGELSTEAILAEKCVVPKVTEAAGLSSPSKTYTELSIKVLVEYTEQSVSREMDPPLLCVEHDNMNTEKTECCTHCSGQTFKEYTTTNGFIESDQTLNDDTEGLNQLFDECTQNCECFKSSKSSELRVNHNLASESSPCCEHCPEHLLLFLQCEPSDQHSGSLEFEADELEGNCGTLGQSGMSDFIPECTDRLESLQQYELSDQDSFDSEQDRSTEDSEQSFSQNISGSVDSLNCAAELCECHKSKTQTEHTDDDGDEEDESYETVQHEGELSDEEDTTDFTDVPFESDVGVMHLLTEEEIFEQTSEIDAGELSRNDDSEYECECEPTPQCPSGYSVEFCREEDGSSEDSSVETKSFKTCLDDSCLSDPCSDSEESDKGVQEDSSDEPMQWESLKESNKEKHKIDFNRSDDEQKKTPTVNVIEDFFDLFDSADCYGHIFAQNIHYISCFDGGDIHDRLHLEEEVQRCCDKTVYKLDDIKKEIGEHDNDKCSKDEAELSLQDNEVNSEDASELSLQDNEVNSEDASELNVQDDDVDSEDASELNVQDDDVDSEDASELSLQDNEVNSEDASELNVQDNEVNSEDASELSLQDDDVDSEDASELNVHDDDVDSEDASELNVHDDDVDSEDASELNVHDDDVDSEDASELNVHDDDVDSEDAAFDSEEGDSSQRDGSYDSENQSDDWTIKSESSSTKDDTEEKESEILYKENNEEAKDDEASVNDEAFVFEGHISDACGKELKVCLHSGNEENMFAPYAQEISVEGDAYEDVVSASKNRDSPGNATFTDDTEISSDLKEDETEKPDPEHNEFLACSEMEPYWALIDQGKSEEFCEPDVEDYYRYQIKSIQLYGKPDLNGFIMDKHSNQQKSDETPDDNSSHNENKGTFSSLGETESQDMEVCSEESKPVGFGITVVEKTQNEQCENECELDEISAEISPPLDIIYSVVSKLTNETTQTRDSDEEQSDDESIELCECEYCIPPTQQVPVKPLLSQVTSDDLRKICVVIDLDETLVHSSFKPLNNADFIIPVEIDGTLHQVYVLKRPHVDEFLKRMGELFECVLFTASLSKYADPVSDLLDKCGAFQSRLFREACVFHKGNYVKDLSRLGRDLNKVIIIDNSPASYIFHPDNAVPVVSWFDDKSDTELLDLLPFFERLSRVDDIYDILKEQRTSS